MSNYRVIKTYSPNDTSPENHILKDMETMEAYVSDYLNYIEKGKSRGHNSIGRTATGSKWNHECIANATMYLHNDEYTLVNYNLLIDKLIAEGMIIQI